MRRVLLTLLGLILITALAFSCFRKRSQSIEEGLIAKTKNALQQKGFEWANVSLKGKGLNVTNIVTLSGVAPSLEAKNEAERVAFKVVGVGGVDNKLQVSSNKTENQAEMVVEQNTAPTSPTTESEEKVNSQNIDKVASQIEEKNSKEAQKSEEPKEEATPTPTATPPSTYNLYAKKEEDGSVVIEGYVPTKELHEEIITKLTQTIGKEKVTDKIEIKANAPKDWQYISTFLVEKLLTVDYGDMNLSNYSYTFNAHLPTHEKKMAFLNSIKEVMSNPDNHFGRYRGDYVITAPIPGSPIVAQTATSNKASENKKEGKTKAIAKSATPKLSCQEKLDRVIGNQKIYFDYDKATIKQGSYPLLDKIALVLKQCNLNGKHLEVEGHTDSIGSTSYNKKLSQRRAQSVVDYLVQRGVDSSKLIAVGYGESRPIASNMTKAGRAQNRRIEFKIKK